MVQATLQQLDVWFREPTPELDRYKLLSKMAVIELCGWLEGEFDRILKTAQVGVLDDLPWIESNVVKRTNGFHYGDHFRPMITRLLGEGLARKVERKCEEIAAGELDGLKSTLGTLWTQRCSFAHADIITNIAAQQQFQAPSWTLNQYTNLDRQIKVYEAAVAQVLFEFFRKPIV